MEQRAASLLAAPLQQHKRLTFGATDVELMSTWLRMPDERRTRYLDPTFECSGFWSPMPAWAPRYIAVSRHGFAEQVVNAPFALSTRIDVWLLPQPVKIVLQCASHESAVLIGHVLLRPRADAHKQLPERLGAPPVDGFRLLSAQASDKLKGHARLR